MSHSNELYLEFSKLSLFNQLSFKNCLKVCSNDSYSGFNYEDSKEQQSVKRECMFNCSSKYEFASRHCEKIGQSHQFYKKNYQADLLKKLEEDKKVENLINKLF